MFVAAPPACARLGAQLSPLPARARGSQASSSAAWAPPSARACRRAAGRSPLLCTAMRTSAIIAKQRREAVALRERGLLPRDAATWEANPFVAFCRAARTDAVLCKALDMLEDTCALDPNLLLLCLWLPTGCSVQLTIQNAHGYAQIAARWRSRVYGGLQVAAASLQAEDVAGLETATLLREQLVELQDRVDTAEQSALFEHASALAAVGKPVGGASAVSGEGAAWLAAADNLKLYLEFAGSPLDVYNRERLQHVFSKALEPHAGTAPQMKDIWPRVEPTVTPPRRLDAMQKNKRYHLAKQAYKLAIDSWKSATQAYRRTRRRVRAFRHEVYRVRREVRQEWR